MRIVRLTLALLLTLSAALMQFVPAQAAPGLPGSPDFGYGARLELDGPYFQDALELAGDLPLDWLAVTVSWSAFSSDPDGPSVQRLNRAMEYAGRRGIPVLVSISHAPAAALSAAGPDPDKTAAFVLDIARRYRGVLQAVELFPAANTTAAWGAPPNPRAYAVLFLTVRAALEQDGSPITLVAAGLKPSSAALAAQEMDDLVYLQSLYDAGLIPPVISLTLDDLTGDPLAVPSGSEHRLLRHYEEVRQVMLKNQHANGLLWITSFSAPSGTIKPSDQLYQDRHKQVPWLLQAFTQLRAQLYIGVAIYQSINPPAGVTPYRTLILSDQDYHPFTNLLRNLVYQNSPGPTPPTNGRPKNEALDKQRT